VKATHGCPVCSANAGIASAGPENVQANESERSPKKVRANRAIDIPISNKSRGEPVDHILIHICESRLVGDDAGQVAQNKEF
jgi:hypothetical protein